MSGPAPDEALKKLVGEGVATGLTRWCLANRRPVIVPPFPWTAKGFTEAFVASLIVRDPAVGDLNLALKVAGEQALAERGVHDQALLEAPQNFRKEHLVELRYDLIELGIGRIGYFQDLAGGSSRTRPVGKLLSPSQDEDAVATCVAAADGVTDEWNTARLTTERSSVRQFLRNEIGYSSSGGVLDSLGRWAAAGGWADLNGRALRVTGKAVPQRIVPDPLLLLGESSLGDREMLVHTGRSHGDLHLGNLLVPSDDRGTQPGSYRLIDLSTYQATGPRSRDLAALLLSGVAHLWPELSRTNHEHLVDDVANFDGTFSKHQHPLVLDLIRGVPRAMTAHVANAGFAHDWRVEFALGLLAAALRSTTHESLGPELRWWFVQLAGRLTARYLDIEEVTVSLDSPVELAMPATGSTPSPTAAAGAAPPTGAARLRGLVHGGMSTRDADR